MSPARRAGADLLGEVAPGAGCRASAAVCGRRTPLDRLAATDRRSSGRAGRRSCRLCARSTSRRCTTLLRACAGLSLVIVVVRGTRCAASAASLVLDPLRVPPPYARWEEIVASPSARLFAQRAERVSAGFRLDAATAGPVGRDLPTLRRAPARHRTGRRAHRGILSLERLVQRAACGRFRTGSRSISSPHAPAAPHVRPARRPRLDAAPAHRRARIGSFSRRRRLSGPLHLRRRRRRRGCIARRGARRPRPSLSTFAWSSRASSDRCGAALHACFRWSARSRGRDRATPRRSRPPERDAARAHPGAAARPRRRRRRMPSTRCASCAATSGRRSVDWRRSTLEPRRSWRWTRPSVLGGYSDTSSIGDVLGAVIAFGDGC